LESDLWNEIEESWMIEHKTLRATREQFSRDPQYYVFMTARWENALQCFSGTSQYYRPVISSG